MLNFFSILGNFDSLTLKKEEKKKKKPVKHTPVLSFILPEQHKDFWGFLEPLRYQGGEGADSSFLSLTNVLSDKA